MRSSTRTTLASLAFAAASIAQGKELPRVTVKCVDGDGKAVAGAEVHLFQHRKSANATADYVPSGPHRTDANGVAVTAIAVDYDGGRFDRWLYARVPGKLVGGLRWFRFDDSPVAEPVIRMAPSREVRGRVQVPEGMTAQSVRVRTLSVSAMDDTSPFGAPFPRRSEFVGLRDTLPDVFDAGVADDGTFVLRDVPGRPLLYLAAEGEGLGQAQWCNAVLPERRIPDVVEMVMAPEAVAAGTVSGPDGKPLPGAALSLRIDRSSPSTGVQCTFEARSDASGHFRIGGLPAGEFQLTVQHPTGVMRPLLVQLTNAQQKADLRVQLEEGIEVRGTVVGLPDRVGLERVAIAVVTEDDHHWRLGGCQTDPQGRFALRLPKGRAMIYVAGVPRGYQQPRSTYDSLLHIDVQPGDKSLADVVFEVEPAK